MLKPGLEGNAHVRTGERWPSCSLEKKASKFGPDKAEGRNDKEQSSGIGKSQKRAKKAKGWVLKKTTQKTNKIDKPLIRLVMKKGRK